MNRQTASAVVGALHPGSYQFADWFGKNKAVATFSAGFARNTVADFGLSGVYNSGVKIEESVTVTDKQSLRAIRRLQRAN